ncbi:MAG: SH3 domain-containing protein [Defluviitaleaceae bacterium]|nr:SH3 domain-containing protein [Defluviitaleaceae bacterium]
MHKFKNIVKKAVATMMLVTLATTPVFANHLITLELPTVASTSIPQARQAEWLACVSGVNQGSTLSVRSGLGASYRIVGSLQPRTLVAGSNWISPQNGFWNIHHPMAGWVSSSFLGNISGSISNPSCPA